MKNHLGEIQNVALGDFDQAIEVEAEQKLTECVGTPVWTSQKLLSFNELMLAL